MSRRNELHTPQTLKQLGAQLIRAGEEIQAAADRMRAEKIKELSLSHQAPIDEGLKGVQRFLLGIHHKIDSSVLENQ